MADKKTPNTKATTSATSSAQNKRSTKRKTTKAAVAKRAKTAKANKPVVSSTANSAIESTATPETASAPTPVPSQAVSAKSGNGLSVLALLLSLGALAASGYLVYSNTLKNAVGNTNLAVGLTEIQGNVGRIGDVVTSLKGDVQKMNEKQSSFVSGDVLSQQLQQQFQEQVVPIQEQQSALSQTLKTVRQQVSGDDSEYVISRISQLLEKANVELNLSKNIESALLALGLAEEQIRVSNNRSLDVVRTKLLADIDALKATEKADLTAISAKIVAASSTIEEWPLKNEPNAELIETQLSGNSDTPKEAGFLEELKSAAAQMVKDAVRVQKVDATPRPLLVPEQRYFLNQNLRLQLLTAQNAALQGEQTIYQDNLASASQWIKEYFDLRDQRVQNVLKAFDEISGVTLKPELHDISATLKSFNDATANPSKG